MYVKAEGKQQRKKEKAKLELFVLVSAKASWLKGTRVPRFINNDFH